MQKLSNFLSILFLITYSIISIIDFFAIIKGFEVWFGWHPVFAGTLGLIVTWIPFVGAIAGYKGLVYVFGWPKSWSLLFVSIPYIIQTILFILNIVISAYESKKNKIE